MPANLLLKMTPLADWLCSRINFRTSFHPTCTLTSSLLVLSPHPHCILSASQNPCLSVLVIKFIGPINPEALESQCSQKRVTLGKSLTISVLCASPVRWGEDAVSDGQWVWGAARTLVTQRRWSLLTPAALLLLYGFSSPLGLLNDHSCQKPSLGLLCEYLSRSLPFSRLCQKLTLRNKTKQEPFPVQTLKFLPVWPGDLQSSSSLFPRIRIKF